MGLLGLYLLYIMCVQSLKVIEFLRREACRNKKSNIPTLRTPKWPTKVILVSTVNVELENATTKLNDINQD